jgi:hypothetical protein
LQKQSIFGTLLGSPIVQAFAGAGITAFLIHVVSHVDYEYVFGFGGRFGGDGLFISIVFLGILGYRFAQQYIARS